MSTCGSSLPASSGRRSSRLRPCARAISRRQRWRKLLRFLAIILLLIRFPVQRRVTRLGCRVPAVAATLTLANGQIPTSMMDPNSLALLKLYPQPNIDPATHSGYNFQYLDQSPQNRWELMEKIDYAVSENTKITVSYNRQDETDLHPVQVWWAPAFSLPYASPLIAPTTSNVTMANVTHVFSPTLTNETVFTYARYINPVVAENPQAINPSTIGFQTPGCSALRKFRSRT